MTLRNTKFLLSFLFSLLLLLSSGCKPSSSTSSTANPNEVSTAPTFNLSGTITYDFVDGTGARLNYAGTIQKPVRNAYIELVNAATNTVVTSGTTNDSGQYSLNAPSDKSVKLRIYAEMKNPPVIIQDNTNSDAQYVLVTASFNVPTATTKNIRALSGWTGTNALGSYTSTRQAAPFAILDSVYSITKKIMSARPALSFPACRINWSVNNISSTTINKNIGQIGTSHFDPSDNQLYILGKADSDTDEYDSHVIVHEWGHFFESNLSRSDSMGGAHGSGDAKDMSLAFGEGFGNALSAMAFDPDVTYDDTYGAKQQSGFTINVESGADINKGWYSESSVQHILYDIYDSTTDPEAGDNVALGIGPVIDVFTGFQKETPAATSIFSFIYAIKNNVPASAADIDTLTSAKNITPVTSEYGVGETNDATWDKNLPLYNSLTLGGGATSLWLYGDFGLSDSYGMYNTAFNNKYVMFTASSSRTRLVVTSTDTFAIGVYNKGTEVFYADEERLSAGAFGPFTYEFTTVPGQVYRINIYTDQSVVFSSASTVALTVTGTAL